MLENYSIARDDYKTIWNILRSQFTGTRPKRETPFSRDFFGSQFITMHIRERLFSELMCPRLATAAYTAAAKHFVKELISNT